jgi:cysteine synthase
MLQDLEERGELGPEREGRGIVEPTSGNTGISLAAMARARGYHMRAVVPERIPEEKKVMLKIAGADVDVVRDAMCPVPGQSGGTVNLAKTHAKAQKHRYVMPNQYQNENNINAHYRTTGPEIWKQTTGAVTHVFLSLGTCGTVSGLGSYLKEQNPKIKIIAVSPTEGHDVPGLRNVEELSVTQLYRPELIDEVLEIDYELAYKRALQLCQNEGLLAGPSSGLVFEGALRYTEREELTEGTGVMIFCDNVFKYASSMQQHLPELSEEEEGHSTNGQAGGGATFQTIS